MNLSWAQVCTLTVLFCSALGLEGQFSQDEEQQLQRRQFVGGPRGQDRQAGQARCVMDGINMCGYETHQQMIGRLRNIEQRNPNIAKVRRKRNQFKFCISDTSRLGQLEHL